MIEGCDLIEASIKSLISDENASISLLFFIDKFSILSFSSIIFVSINLLFKMSNVEICLVDDPLSFCNISIT